MSKPLPAVPAPITWTDALCAFAFPRGARERLEEELAQLHGARAVYLVSSGRAALWVALMALKRLYPSRQVVLVPAYTCPTVGRAVVAAGLKPFCVDISLETFNLSPQALEQALESVAQPLAVVVAHMFGAPCDMVRICERARAAGAIVIEDIAQATGARLNGRVVGSFGEVAFASFGRGKPVRGHKGGALIVNRDELVEPISTQVSKLPSRRIWDELKEQAMLLAVVAGSVPRVWQFLRRLRWLHIGEEDTQFDPRPSRLAGWQAKLALTSLHRAARYAQHRHMMARIVEQQLSDVEFIRPQAKLQGSECVYPRLALRVTDPELREPVLRALQDAGIDARAFYSAPMYGYEWWPREVRQPPCPNAEAAVRTNLILPLCYRMNERDALHMARVIRQAIAEVVEGA